MARKNLPTPFCDIRRRAAAAGRISTENPLKIVFFIAGQRRQRGHPPKINRKLIRTSAEHRSNIERNVLVIPSSYPRYDLTPPRCFWS